MRHLLVLALAALPIAAQAAPLTPDQGAVAYSGTLTDSDGRPGHFDVEAKLEGGDFSGRARITTSDYTVEGPVSRGWLENGRCYFRVESGRERGEFSGTCDTDGIDGRFETFHPGGGLRTGTIRGSGQAAQAEPASASVPLPTMKLTCAYQDRKISFAWGEPTQYHLTFSNMGSLTLTEAGAYRAGSGAEGRFERAGNKIRLVSGPWEGAVGTVERGRSGEPAVVFKIEENRGPDGVHRVDPYTTRCTHAR